MAEYKARQTAQRVWVADLFRGKFIPSSGEFEPNFIEVKDILVSRVNLVGTIVNSFSKIDGGYSMIGVDDGSAAIEVRTWGNENVELEGLQVGDFVTVIGRVKMFNDRLYIIPEVVRKLDDPAWLKLRRMELINLYGEPERVENVVEEDVGGEEEVFNEENVVEEDASLREKVLSFVENHDDGVGVPLKSILNKLSVSEGDVFPILTSMLKDGEIFELGTNVYRVMP